MLEAKARVEYQKYLRVLHHSYRARSHDKSLGEYWRKLTDIQKGLIFFAAFGDNRLYDRAMENEGTEAIRSKRSHEESVFQAASDIRKILGGLPHSVKKDVVNSIQHS